jgi:hypothetical protein
MITYTPGDATCPAGEGLRLLIHIVNDKPAWGLGFVVSLSKKWSAPERAYRAWAREREQTGLSGADSTRQGAKYPPFELGQIQIVQVEPTIFVANMLAQHDIRWHGDVPPIRYEALREALSRVAHWAVEHGASIHGPRLGAGLAGGVWGIVEQLLKEAFDPYEIPVTIYDLPKREEGGHPARRNRPNGRYVRR